MAERLIGRAIFFNPNTTIMKKNLFFLILLCCLFSCKKDAQTRLIAVTTSNIGSTTTFSFKVVDTTTGKVEFDVPSSSGNYTDSFSANSGDVLNAQYSFTTQNQQYGQGNIDFTYNGETLYHANGGSGQNIIITVP